MILASGDAVNGIYYQSPAGPDPRRPAAGRLSRLLRPLEGPGRDPVSAVLLPGGRAHRLPAHLLDPRRRRHSQPSDRGRRVLRRARLARIDGPAPARAVAGARDAAVALRHPDGQPLRRQIVAVEDVVAGVSVGPRARGIEGETFLIAMTDPFDYAQAAGTSAARLGIETIDLVDPIGHDFCIDTTKARNKLGYRPQFDIGQLIDQAVEFRRSGRHASAGFGLPGLIDGDIKRYVHASRRIAMSLEGKVILVTGGTSGIGEACTEWFARGGAKVVAASIQDEAGEALARRLSGEGHVLPVPALRRQPGARRPSGRRAGRRAALAGWTRSCQRRRAAEPENHRAGAGRLSHADQREPARPGAGCASTPFR